MKRFNFLMMLCIGVLALSSCREIFEKDIEDQAITIYTPNGKDSISYSQIFWWEQIDFATSYQLQVVSPSFEAPERMILDTVVKSTRFPYYIGPGNFEWKVRAMNGAYKTNYFGNKFHIDTTDLRLQVVNLKSPSNSSNQSLSSITFIWDRLLGAKSYQIQIDTTGSFNTPVKSDYTQALSYPWTLPFPNKLYYWKVRALNGKDTTEWSNIYTFNFDNTTPPKVTLSTPANGAVDRETSGTLQWVGLGTGYTYKVRIKVGANAETTQDVSTNSCIYTAASGQEVKWSVSAVNSARTEGPLSDTWSFKVK